MATIPNDIERLCALAGIGGALNRSVGTILKDNISWHYPFPGANTTPWQLEGAILALQRAGFLNTKRHYTHTWIHRTLVDRHFGRKAWKSSSEWGALFQSYT